jgi:hypothetical protein
MDIEAIGTGVALVLTLMVYCYLGKEIPILNVIYRAAIYVFVGVALGYGAIIAWHNVLVPRLWTRLESGQWWYVVPLVLCVLLLFKIKPSWSGVGSLTMAFIFGVGAALVVGGGIVGTLLPQVEATFLSLNPADYRGVAALESNSPWILVVNALLVVLGTMGTLMYFFFSTEGGSRREKPVAPPATVPARDTELRLDQTELGSDESRPDRGGPPASFRFRPSTSGLRRQVLHLSTAFGKVFIMFAFGALFATAAISRISLLVDRVRFIIETIWSFIPVP